MRTLLLNPLDTNKLILGTSNGMYKSDNSGATWTRVSGLNFRQVLYCPTDTGVLYGTREGSGSAQIIRSVNGGLSWTTVTSFTDARRINLAVTPAADYVVRAIAANGMNGLLGVYNSFDYGATFTDAYIGDASCSNNLLSYDVALPTVGCNGQGSYDLCIANDPVSPDKLIMGGINNYYSIDGGYNWAIANKWYSGGPDLEEVHADKHFLAYNPLNHAIYLGCDGGLYKNYDPLGGEWKDITNGMGITQFYRNAVDNGVTFCLGGSQDNGSKKIDAGTSTDMTGGDGMQPLINYGDPANVFFCAYQNGYVDRTIDGGVTFNSITNDLPTPGAWITPYVMHPSQPNRMYIGYKQVFESADYGSSWGAISPEFSPSRNIQVLSIAPSDANYMYVVEDVMSKSAIYYTTNGGASWISLTTPPPNGIYVTDLVVDPLDAARFWVTFSGYGSSYKVYSYSTATGSWTDDGAGLPNIPVNCLVVDSFSKTKYVGTDVAVFYKTTEMTAWALYNNHLPSVEVFDLNINHRTSELWAATYGRGMWKSQKNEMSPPLPPIKVGSVSIETEEITLSPNPCHDVFTIQSTSVPFRNAAVTVRLVTVDGKTVQTSAGTFDTGGKLKVSVSGLPAGMYFCEVGNEKGVARGKVVVY